MDTKINTYILSIFLKQHNFSDNYDSNISDQHFVNTKKFTFEIDDLQKCRRKWDATLAGWWRHQL